MKKLFLVAVLLDVLVWAACPANAGSLPKCPPDCGSAHVDTVKFVQFRLSADGYDVGPIDGIVGPQTRDALERYQRANQIPASGSVDKATLSTFAPQ